MTTSDILASSWRLFFWTGPKKGQIEVPGGGFICATNKNEYTNKKWSFCNVYPCIRATNRLFCKTDTQKNSGEQNTFAPSFVYLCICISE